MASPKLQIVVGADISRAEKNFKTLSAKIKGLGKDFSSFGFSVTRMTAPLTAWGGSAVAASLKIQECFKTIRAGTGATGDALKGLTADFKAVSAKTAAPLSSVATAVADLNTRLGLSGEPLQKMAVSVAEAARMMGEDVKTLANEAAKAMNDAGISANQGAAFMDKLFLASQSTGIGMSALAGKLYKFGTPLRAMGFDLEETIALLGSFDKAGVNTDLVMSSMRIALGKMAKAGETNVPGALRKAIQSIKEAGDSGTATGLAIATFGQKAGPDMAGAIREGKFSVDGLIESLEKSKGAISENAAATDLFTEKWVKVKNKITLSLQPLGDAIISLSEKYILPLAESVSNLSPSFSEWTVALGACVVALGPVTWALGTFITVVTSGSGAIASLYFGIKKFYVTLAASGALTALIRDMGAAGVAMSATSAAAKTTAASMVAASSGAGKLRLAMSGLGTALAGPVGIIAALTSVAAVLGYVYLQSSEKAREKTQKVTDAVDALKTEIEDFSADRLSTALQKQMSTIDSLNAKLAETENRLKNFDGAITGVMAVGPIGQITGQMNRLQDAIALEKAKSAALEKALQDAQAVNAVKSGQVLSSDITGSVVKNAVKLRINAMRDSIKYEGAHPAAYLEELRQMLNTQPKELTDDKKRILDAISDFSGQKKSGGSSVSAVAARVSAMRDEIKYNAADPASFLTELESLYSKMPAALTDDKKAIMDMQDEIVNAVSEKQSEASEKLKAAREETLASLQFGHDMGLVSTEDYSAALLTDFEAMKAQLADPSLSNWTEDMKSRFRELQAVVSDVAVNSMDSLKKQFENGVISSGVYEAQLAALLEKYKEYPQVVKEVEAAMASVKEQAPSFTAGMAAALKDAQKAMDNLTVSIGTGLSDGFARAIAYSEDLGKALQQLGQDIIYTVTKAWLLQSFTGIFGIGTGVSSVAANGKVFDQSGVIPFARGGVISSPTLFKFAGGTGLMGEAGPEAIMPLERDGQGRLGVAAHGGMGMASLSSTVNITVENRGGGDMTNEQAEKMGKQIQAAVDARVMENLYQYQRSGYFKGAYAR